MNYFIGLIFVTIVFLGANIYEKNISKLKFYIGILIINIGVLGFGQYQYNTASKTHGLINSELVKLYETKIDSLENQIEILNTDAITINEWKFYGDTIQYIGKDSILFIYPVDYYRLMITTNEQIKNKNLSIEAKFYNDTIIKANN